MKARQFIIIGVAIGILLIGKFTSDFLASSGEKHEVAKPDNTSTVFTTLVKNSEQALFTKVTGLIEAVDRVELYSEVQGVMLADAGRFKAGTRFNKGETLLGIRADDVYAKLVSQRSTFERSLTAVMADVRLDYPDEYPVWQSYLEAFNVEKPVQDLPAVKSSKLKGFITGRNIYSEFYAIRNAEIILSKYRISAPFSGVLVEAAADPGTVIRAGQKLGVFIKPGHYEMSASVSPAKLELLKVGQEVLVTMEGHPERTWKGKVSRINKALNSSSQLGEFFAEIHADDLTEGMFVEAEVGGQSLTEAFEIPRSVLFDENQVFIVQDSLLAQVTVEPLHFKSQTVIVRGLKDGMEVLTKIPPGSFVGMSVKVYSETSAQ
jgi:multidrug efflux pump subunit AcrA (membrane-fusion protein)